MVHALLDSQSAAAAFRFTIRPGEQTVFDTEMALYPRDDIATVGHRAADQMFLFDANDRARVDDYRDAVHDSNGLLLLDRQGRADLASARQSARRCRSARSPTPTRAASA